MSRFHILAGVDDTPAHPEIRHIGLADIKSALAKTRQAEKRRRPLA